MADHERHNFRIDRRGRALIPKPMREAMGLADGGEAVAWLEGERLVVEPREAVLRQLKARFRSVEGSMSEELVRERREEARRKESVRPRLSVRRYWTHRLCWRSSRTNAARRTRSSRAPS